MSPKKFVRYWKGPIQEITGSRFDIALIFHRLVFLPGVLAESPFVVRFGSK
jgi:hypothetical protein